MCLKTILRRIKRLSHMNLTKRTVSRGHAQKVAPVVLLMLKKIFFMLFSIERMSIMEIH